MKNDFAALMCVQQRPPEQFEAISETCEQVLWTYKNELTKGGHLIQQVEDVNILLISAYRFNVDICWRRK